jgi:hypothetical protein
MTTRIQVSGKSWEGRAGYLHPEPRSCGNADSGVPEINVILVNHVRLKQLRRLHRTAESRANFTLGQLEDFFILTYLGQRYEPIGILR